MIDGYPWGQGRLWLFTPYIPHWYLRDSMPSEKIKDFPDSSSKQQPPEGRGQFIALQLP
jgi:hypothetical protein